MKKELLIEILCEELPAIPFLKEEPNILPKWQNIVREYGLDSEFKFFYTPRRLVLQSSNFPTKQEDKEVEQFGPPIQIACIDGDKSKGLSKAGESFLKKCQTTQVQTIQKDGKEVLYFSQKVEGAESEGLLGEMIIKWLEGLNFGKSMRWGSLQTPFIRPIRNIAVLFGGKSVEFEAYGIKSRAVTFIHRDFGFESQSFASFEDYRRVLEKGGVILDPDKRRDSILKGLGVEDQEIANKYKKIILEKGGTLLTIDKTSKSISPQIKAIEKELSVDLEKELFDEVVAITENPKAVYGEFEKEFLELPKEVIITSMKVNQRYFATYSKDNAELHNGFIAVINSMSDDSSLIIAGNEKVLRARLSDAMFFYHNDLKKPLASYDLSKIAFVEGLGSMQDKVRREGKIAEYLVSQYPVSQDTRENLREAVKISKSDLLSEMVGEFPELQGIMGAHYVIKEQSKGVQNRNHAIARALVEQYKPNSEEDTLPTHPTGIFLALSYRLDFLMALFSIGKFPSGSKDPYGLRRSGNAILRILEYPIALSYESLQTLAKKLTKEGEYQTFDVRKVWEFLLERLEGVLKINASIVRSVINGREKDLHTIMQKALALNEVFEGADKEAVLSTFKRVANITKDMQGEPQEIQSNFFQIDQEQKLYEEFERIKSRKNQDPKSYIGELFSLKDSLEEFFENVMVNVDDQAIRENRKNLIYAIYWEFLEFGDIKEITI